MILHKFSPSRLEAYASPLVVVGTAVILALVVVALSFYNVNREKRFVSTLLSEKGAVLVRSFEAGARAGMMGMSGVEQRIQVLAEQFALLPGVTSITLTDARGVIRADSDEEKVGSSLLSEATLRDFAPSDTLQWRIMEQGDGTRVFVVYKFFTPLPPRGGRPGERHPEHMGNARRRGVPGRLHERMQRNWQHFCTMMGDPGAPQVPGELPKTLIFIGMDIAPFEEAKAQDVRTIILMGATLLALGLGGMVALFWAQRLRVSRRMLQDTRALAEEVITHLPIGLVVMDPAGRITMVNQAADAVLGAACNLAPGAHYETCLPRDVVEVLRRVSRGEDVVERQVNCEMGAREPLPLSVSGAQIFAEQGRLVGSILLLRDLREIKRLQDAVRRAEKLAAIGSLAAGVAHEIRNPLSSIKASATYFGSQFLEGSDGKRMSAIMIQEVERLNRAVTQLLEYARPSDLARQEVELAPLVRRSLELMRRDARAKGVEVVLDPGDAPDTVLLDPDRFIQALLNLYLNAIQAMEKGGTLSVRLSRDNGDAAPQRVRIVVEDTGPGLPEESLERIFDPYFTTKAKGTGLGLAIVQKIVEAHQGEVRVHSAPGKGAAFTIIVPVA